MEYRLILLRHGQSLWNKQKRFTGWKDIGLSEKGERRAKESGKKIVYEGLNPDTVFTSILKRSTKSAKLAIESFATPPKIVKSWRLNERNYGALQGLYKIKIGEEFGQEQLQAWRRGWLDRPPLLELDDERLAENKLNKNYPPESDENILGESLKDTYERVAPFFESEIKPEILNNKLVLIVAHGNSLRAIVKHIENLSGEGISQIEIPTGDPLVYTLNEDLKMISKKYLKDWQKD